MSDESTSPATGAGPWQQDLELTFADPQVRATVDAFMRAKVQPRMTQLESSVAQAREAQELVDAFQTDPEGTYRALTTQMWGEYGDAVLSALDQRINGSSTAGPGAAATTPPAPAPTTTQADPRVEEVYQFVQSERERRQQEDELRAYDSVVEQIVTDPANADIDPDLFHKYVNIASGDFEKAITLYRENAARELTKASDSLRQQLGMTEEQFAELKAQAAANAAAPPVMGSSTSGAGAPIPTAPDYRGSDGLKRAIDETMRDVFKVPAPPVMGNQ